MMKKDPNKYPAGWNRRRTEAVIGHYDAQSEEQAIAEADAAFENSRLSLVRVPVELVSEVERLISRRQAKRRAVSKSRPRTRKSA